MTPMSRCIDLSSFSNVKPAQAGTHDTEPRIGG
jgi:hypothetical protein